MKIVFSLFYEFKVVVVYFENVYAPCQSADGYGCAVPVVDGYYRCAVDAVHGGPCLALLRPSGYAKAAVAVVWLQAVFFTRYGADARRKSCKLDAFLPHHS